jgi:nucleoside-diphosphate-sugar epimerase
VKVLITGGAGFIGHNVTRLLSEQGHECAVVDSVTNYGFIPKDELQYLVDARLKEERIGKIKGIYPVDIRDTKELPTIFNDEQPDVVIHLASYPRQKVVSNNPLLASDVMSTGLIHLLELSKKYNVKKFVYISSSMVYGDFENDVDETAVCHPIGQYGIMKYMGEKLVEDYARQGAFDYTIIRPSAVYGEWDVEDRVVSKFMTAAMRGEVLKVNGADEVLDFTYVEDTAMGIALSACSSISDNNIYNITRSEERQWTLKEAAELAIEIAGTGTLELQDRDLSFPKRGRLDISRAKQDLGYDPKINVEEGFRRYHDWYSQNPVLWRR